MNTADVIQKLFELQIDAKLYHWQTQSYANHKAVGELYDAIISLTDEMIEVAMGRSGRPKMGPRASVRIRNMTKRDMVESVRGAVSYFERLDTKFKDVAALRDDLLAALSKTLYLLTLNNNKNKK